MIAILTIFFTLCMGITMYALLTAQEVDPTIKFLKDDFKSDEEYNNY